MNPAETIGSLTDVAGIITKTMNERRFSTMEYIPLSDCPSGIYKIVCTINGHFYVGSAVNLWKRYKAHVTTLVGQRHRNIHLQRAYNLYGLDAFTFTILEYVPDTSKLIEREQFFIDSLKPEYNINPTAGSPLGRIVSPETILKLSESHKGIKPTKEALAKRKATMTGRIFGPRSEEACLNISLAHMGVSNGPCSEETARKISEANKDREFSEEHRANLCKAWEKRRANMTEEDRAKLGSGKDKKQSPETIAKRVATRANRTTPPKSPGPRSPEACAKTTESLKATWARRKAEGYTDHARGAHGRYVKKETAS